MIEESPKFLISSYSKKNTIFITFRMLLKVENQVYSVRLGNTYVKVLLFAVPGIPYP